MSLQEIIEKIKATSHSERMFPIAMVGLVAIGSFGLGSTFGGENPAVGPSLLSTHRSTPAAISLSYEESHVSSTTITVQDVQSSSTQPLTEGTYVGSKNGTKYHLPWCSGALRILEENKVWFRSADEAKAKGYTPAANCKGI